MEFRQLLTTIKQVCIWSLEGEEDAEAICHPGARTWEANVEWIYIVLYYGTT